MLDYNTEHEDSNSIIESALQISVRKLFDTEPLSAFFIPLYQREYVWQKRHAEDFFDDINDNPEGYFIGPIICVKHDDGKLELIDGQQRMTTLSLLFAAIYSKLYELRGYNDTLCDEHRGKLEQRLIFADGDVRLVPQIQNNNKQDYSAVLKECGLKIPSGEKMERAGNRRIFTIYYQFCQKLSAMIKEEEMSDKIRLIIEFLGKISKARLIAIQAKNISDGYTLFDSLNNRGEPLNHMDIIKNNLLFQLESERLGGLQAHFDRWVHLLKLLDDNFKIQERFTRHYYNACVKELRPIAKERFAMHSNRIRIYEKLIKNDPEKLLKNLLEAGEYYSRFFAYDEARHAGLPLGLRKAFCNLERIGGAPSYMLLLNLHLNQDKLQISDEHIADIASLLVRFFVRRNLMDYPAFKKLDTIFMGIMDRVSTCQGEAVVKAITDELKEKSSTRGNFYRRLTEDSIYLINREATRFILCAMEEDKMTPELQRDLWVQEGRAYELTIEHIFPQGENMKEHWVQMIADGDRERAEEYRKSHAHRLGNLTLTASNSSLSDDNFLEKRDKEDENGVPIGYKRAYLSYKKHLWLNEDLVNTDHWSVEQINDRTEKLAKECLKLFALDDSELQQQDEHA